MAATNYIGYTAAINPPSVSPVLTVDQIWAALQIKITSGETFVGGAIVSTDVLKTYKTESGLPATDREIIFREGNRKVKETCIEYQPMKVEFRQPNKTSIMNIVSQGAGGETDLYMTYTFEWLMPGLEGNEQGLKEAKAAQWAMAKTAVESTIQVIRKLVVEGRIK